MKMKQLHIHFLSAEADLKKKICILYILSFRRVFPLRERERKKTKKLISNNIFEKMGKWRDRGGGNGFGGFAKSQKNYKKKDKKKNQGQVLNDGGFFSFSDQSLPSPPAGHILQLYYLPTYVLEQHGISSHFTSKRKKKKNFS